MDNHQKMRVMKRRQMSDAKFIVGLIQVAILIMFVFSSVSAANDKETTALKGYNSYTNISISKSLIKDSSKSNQEIEDSNNGYIIEFDSSNTKEISRKINSQMDLVKKQHEEIKNKITAELYNSNLSLLSDLKLPIIDEYYSVYNGIALNISKDQAVKLLNLPNVKKITANKIYHINMDTSLDWLGVTQVWEKESSAGNGKLTGKGIVVAMIDSGVEITHPMFGNDNNPIFKKCSDFKNCAKVLDAWNFVKNNAEPWDDNGHGTHTASTVAGINDGVLKGGVAPDAKLYIYKVCDNTGGCSESAIVSAIERAVDPNHDGDYSDHANIISMSLGGSGTPDCPSCKAINSAADKGVISIVSAGNSGPSSNTIGCPACAEKAIAVAAACKPENIGKDSQCMNGAMADFSSRGPVIFNGVDYKKPEISAPGVMICAAKASMFKSSKYPDCMDSSHVRISGTSMAAPHMAGIAALIVQEKPGIKWNDFEKLIQSTAKSLGNFNYNTQGAGLINPLKIFNIGEGTTPVTPPTNNTNSTNPPVNPPANNTNSTNPPVPPVNPPVNNTNSTNPPVTPPNAKPEDVNKDGKIDVTDLRLVLMQYGNMCNSQTACNGADVNRDGFVDYTDIMRVYNALRLTKNVNQEEVEFMMRNKKPIGLMPDVF